MTTIGLIVVLLFSKCISAEWTATNNGANTAGSSSVHKAFSTKVLTMRQQNSNVPQDLPPGSIGCVLLQVEGKIKDVPDPLASVLAIVPKGTWIPIFEEKHDDYIKVQHGDVTGYLSIIYIDRRNLPDQVRKYLGIPINENRSSNYLRPEQSYTVKETKTPSLTHMGLEWNMFWNWGDCDIIADYENFAHGSLKSVDETFLDTDFSLQYSLPNKIVLRYSYIVINENADTPVGPDRSYEYGDRTSGDYDWEETTFKYEGSASQNKSHIFSAGYPIRISDIDLSQWSMSGKYPLDVILFGGISFTNNSKLDEYVRTEGFSDWYFMDEHDWYIENRVTDKAIKLSYGISIPLGVQTSIFFTGHDWRILFGVGI